MTTPTSPLPTSPGADAAPVLHAVTTALRSDLAQVTDDDGLRHVLGVADVVLHRAVLEDLRGARRSEATSAVHAVADELGAASTADPFRDLELAAPDLAVTRDRDRRLRALTALVAVDLPELGRASTPEREAAATAAMDWLGREEPARVELGAVQAYLDSRRPPGEGHALVTGVSQLSGGFSKTTLLLSLDSGDPDEVVLRQVPPGRDASSLAAEYGVVDFVWHLGVSAPRPLWLEPADNALGGPFFATARVRGANVGDVFGPRPGTGPEAAIGLAEALARLHQLDASAAPKTPVSPMISRTQILAAIEQQAEQVALASQVDGDVPHPLHALLFAWLREHAPSDVRQPVLLHGDPGFHNMLVEQGEVRALLDWERSRVGDAAQDLAYVRPHVERVQPWSDFLSAYCAAGGRAPDEDHLQWYAVWHDAWRFAGAYRGRARLMTRPRMLLEAVMGLLHAPRFLLSGLSIAYEEDL